MAARPRYHDQQPAPSMRCFAPPRLKKMKTKVKKTKSKRKKKRKRKPKRKK